MATLTPKRLEFLSEVAPAAALAILINPRNPNAKSEAKTRQAAARQLGRELRVLTAEQRKRDRRRLHEHRATAGFGWMIATDPYFFVQRDQIAALTARYALPAVYFHRGFAAAGGLISYGATVTEENRIAGQYTGRSPGEKPGDLPILQPAKIELVVNLKTAKALGLTVPASILARADEVID